MTEEELIQKYQGTDLERPEGLCDDGNDCWFSLIERVERHEGLSDTDELIDTGGCKTFYTPKEWKERGEDYGTESLLVVVHDGGLLSYYLNIDYGDYDRYNLNEEFGGDKTYIEAATCWYSSFYYI